MNKFVDNVGITTTNINVSTRYIVVDETATALSGMRTFLEAITDTDLALLDSLAILVKKDSSNWFVCGAALIDDSGTETLSYYSTPYTAKGTISSSDAVDVSIVLDANAFNQFIVPHLHEYIEEESSDITIDEAYIDGIIGVSDDTDFTKHKVVLYIDSASAVAVTLGIAGESQWKTVWDLVQIGTNQVTLTPDTGCTINGASASRIIPAQWEKVSVYMYNTDGSTTTDWIVSGSSAAP